MHCVCVCVCVCVRVCTTSVGVTCLPLILARSLVIPGEDARLFSKLLTDKLHACITLY